MSKSIISENHLFQDLPFGGSCPTCGKKVIFYSTNENKTRGRYKCNSCSRDTVWAKFVSLSADEIFENFKKRTLDA